MIVRLAIVFLVATVVFAVMRILLRKKPVTIQQFFRLYLLVLAGLALLYFVLVGILPPLFALLGALLPTLARFAGWIPQGIRLFSILNRTGGKVSGTNSPGQVSEINTQYLHMVLFHDTGMMDGEVLLGKYSGSKLGMLELEQILEVRNECSSDADSLSVLEAFLDREHNGWRAQAGAGSANANSSSGSTMNENQAYEILGLNEEATRDEVVEAHRRLIQKLHPDRGGSTYLAARVNEAKSILLAKLEK
jgi:hypothetical protein